MNLSSSMIGYGSLAVMIAIVVRYLVNDEVRRQSSVAQLMAAVVLFGGVGGYMVFDASKESRAFDFVISAIQDKQRLFRDQYELSMPMDNSRGTIVLGE